MSIVRRLDWKDEALSRMLGRLRKSRPTDEGTLQLAAPRPALKQWRGWGLTNRSESLFLIGPNAIMAFLAIVVLVELCKIS